MKRLFQIAAATIALGAAPAAAAPAMWEVSDADSSVFLFGSVHILPPELAWRTPLFEERLAAADAVYFEADIGPLGVIATTFKVAGLMADSAANPWLQLLTDDERDKLGAALSANKMTFEQVAVMPPWLVAISLQAQGLVEQGYKTDAGVDYVLQAELPKERKGYFETAAQQIDLLAGGTLEEEIEMLMATVEPIEQMPEQLDTMVEAWAEGAIDASLAEMLSQDVGMTDEYAEVLLYNRNRNWLPVIEDMLATNKQDFIVVGAAHLAGDGSVIDLLEKAGYTVSRIQ